MVMKILKCDVCEILFFSTKQAYERHLNSKRHAMIESNLNNMHRCHCGKTYKYRSGLSYHKKNCTVPKLNVEILIENYDKHKIYMKQLKEQQEVFDREKERLNNEISILLDKHNGGNTIFNTTNIENQNITININSFGNENINYITNKTIMQCINRVYNSIPCIIEKIHFNPEHPENHNVKITNKKLPYACILDVNNQWKTVDRNDAIESLMDKGYTILDETYQDNKQIVSSDKKRHFDTFQGKYGEHDKDLIRKIKSEIHLMILNGTRY